MLQRLGANSTHIDARVKPDASRWHSLVARLRTKARNFTSILVSIGVAASLLIGVATPAKAASTWSGQGQSTLSTINGTQPFIWWSHLYGSELLYIVKTTGNIFELRSMNSLTSTSTTIMQVPPPYVHLSYDNHTFSWVENAGTFYFVGGNSTYGAAVYKYSGGGTASLAVDVDKTSTAVAFGATSTGSLIKWRNELWFTDSNGSATSTNGLYHWDWTSSTAKLAAVTATNSGGAAGIIQTPTLFNDKIYYRIGTANVSVGSSAGVELYSFDGLKVELAANTYPETFSGSTPNSGTPIAQSANSGLLPTGSASGCNFDGNNDHFVTTSQYMAFYAKSDSSGKFELWVMDTDGNVTNLHGKDPGSLANPNPDCLVNFNDTLYYTGSYDTSVGYELYKVTGGSSPTATLVSDITPGSGSTFISSVHSTGSKMYYYVNGVGVYSFDGTNAAVKVADVPTSGAYNMQGFIPFDGKIWAATTVSSTTVFGSTPIDGATQAPVLAAQPDVTVPTGNITINPPAVTTGPVSLWQISNLPAGLRYDPYTGIISGMVNTPVDLTVGINQVSYVAINSNFYTSTPTKMKLLITNSQPSFPASQSLSTFVNVSDQFAPPMNSGGAATSWSVNPALPTGLSMSSSTGYISGTAPASASSGSYTVTASNAAGATTYTLNFAVKAYAPAYSYNAAYTNTCNYGVTCSNPALPTPIIYFNSLTSASSASFSYAVTGLPDGLAMSSSTGAITGTSTATGTYLLSMVVSNSSGSTTLPLKLTVGGPAPAFTVADVTAPQSSAYTSWVVPTPASGTITSWSATGLPTGLTLNASTGAITGTPTIAGTFNVALTGNNYGTSGNSTTVNFVFTVTPVAPVVTAGQTKTCEASVSGTTACSYTLTTSAGTATSWSITPALPNGLSLNTSTGVISGAALDNTQQLSTAYTVTASNDIGSGSATFMLAINDYALVFTTNSPSSVTVTAFTPMTPWRPITLTAGHIVSCSAFGGALPTGLVINSSTCEISGTPTSGSVTTLLAISALGRSYQNSSSITINVTNVAPTMDPIPDASKGNGLAFSYTPTGKWINTLNSFTCSISANKPTWLGISSTNCTLAGTVPIINNAIGTKVVYSNITVTAANTYGSSSQTFSITALPTKPVFTSAPSYTWAKDSAITTVPHPTLSYNNALSWSISPELPAGLSLDTTTGTITGTPSATMPSTTYTWTATNDGGSTTINANFAVTVQKPAFGTTVYSGAQSLTVDQPMTTINPPAFTNVGSPPTSWAISPALPTGLTFDTTTGSLSGTPTAAKSSTSYTVTSTNSAGTTSFTTFTIVATAVKPTFSAVSTQNLGRGVAYSLTLPNTGSKATSCTKSAGTLPTGISLSLVNGQCALSGTPTTITASSSVSFTASNAAGTSTALTFNIAVIDVPPVLSSVGVQSLTQGVPYTLAAPTNTGGTVTSWSISSGALPAGVTLQSDGSISGTPTTAGSWSATLQATNSGGSATTQLSGNVAEVFAPLLSNPGTRYITMGESSPFIISNSGSAATFTVTSGTLPTGFSLNSSTGEITGTSNTEQQSRNITVTATNYSGSNGVTFAIGVIQPRAILGTTAPRSITQGLPVTIAALANTGGVVATWTASNLPNGLTINSSTGVITGTPTTPQGATNAQITATNSGGDASQTISIEVVALNQPSVTSPGDKVFTMGDPQSFTIVNTGDPATFAVTSGTLPSGFSLDTATGVISGSGTADDTERTIEVTATNYVGSSATTFKMTVKRAPPVLATTTPSQVLNRNAAFTLNAIANSGGSIATWNATGLPAGISIDSTTGVISGTPTTVGIASNATISATNSGGTSSVQVSFQVDPALTPVLADPNDQVLTVGDLNYSLQIVNTGGDGTWTVDAGTLPAGLSINSVTGEITGVPTAEETVHSVTIKVTNPSGANDSVTFNFNIRLPVPNFASATSHTYLQGDAVSLLPATNTGGAVATWSASGLPTGLAINSSTGLITGTVSTSQTASDATITATNSGGSVSYTQSFTVTAMAPPSLSAIANVRLTIQTSYTLQFTNSGYTSTWSATGLPAGFSIDQTTGDITGSSSVEVASRQVTITAQNYAGTDSKTFSFAVVQPIPVIGNISAQTLTRGSVVSITAPSNSGGPVASWSATGLPSGLTINSGTGAITGTPSTLQTATDATISATNSGGTVNRIVSFTVNDVAPSLAAMTSITLTKGTAMTAVSAPSNSGGTILSWASTDLPAGLAINSSTGQITGTPTSLQTATNSTITATNSGGAGSTTISITVNDVAPDLGTLSAITLTKGTAMSAVSAPSNSGGLVVSWSSTNLPAGLSINSSTGEITGTPTTLQSAANATVRATNSGGSATTTISITVNDVAPNLGLLGSVTLTRGSEITAIARPSNSGGAVVTWSSTNLPAGLAIDSSTGQITGTPTAIQAATDSTIKAENSGGSSTATISITVNDIVPSLGALGAITLTKGTAMTAVSRPSNSGGPVVTWSSSDLPAGLAISPSTGQITGTPTALQSATNSTITATNSGGSATTTISITVNDVAPSLGGLSAITLARGTAMNAVSAPTNAGGPVVTWSSTDLPAGLAINPSTGEITGTPTGFQAATSAHVVASNTGGTSTSTISITINNIAPALGTLTAITLRRGTAMTAVAAPSNSGGAVVTWSSTDLPAGLAINSGTGQITGTPTAIQVATDSHVVATNTGGSSTATISITINDITPVLGTLASITLKRDEQMDAVAAPSNSGGPVVTWSSSDLPAGLAINSSTGQITGTPTGFQAATISHIVATNSGGSGSTTISITVNDIRPQLLPLNLYTFTNGVTITPFTPTNQGGAATSWSAANLPNGLVIDVTTGEISGTPIGLDAGHSALIYAYNSGGGHSVYLSYMVTAAAPILGSMSAATLHKGAAVSAINAPTNTGGAVVTWSTSGLPDGLWIDQNSGVISGTPTTVQSATTYTISGTNSGGTASTTISIAVEDSAPQAPTIARISSTSQMLSVYFNPGTNIGTPITIFQYSTDGGLTWRDRDSGTTESPLIITATSNVAHTMLVNGTSYDIKIRAVNSLSGAASAVSSAIPNELPSAPTGVTATLSGTTVQISWTAPVGTVESYEVTSNVGNFSCTTTAPTTSCFIYGLSNGTTYTFTVTASNNAGTSSPSSPTSSVTPDIAPGAPSITGITISGQQMNVAFLAGTNIGSNISKYQYSTDGGLTWRDRANGTTLSPIVITTISGTGNSSLVNGTSYNVQIRAFNTKEGTASGTTTATPDVAPGAPTIDLLTPGNGSLSIAFTAGTNNGSSVTKYQYTTDGSNYKDLVGTTSPITISAISGIANTALANGSEYSIRIRAINTLTGSASTSVTGIPDVRPGSPTISSITSSDSQLSVAYTAASNSGSAITKYQYSTDGGSTWHDRASGTGSPLVIARRSDTNSALVNGTTYSISLRAVNTLNGVASVSVDGTPDMVPQTVRDFSAVSADGQIDLSWTAPLGTPINDYVIEYSSDNGVTYTTFAHTASIANSISVTGLTNGTAYKFRISVVNGTSISDPIISSSVTPRADQSPLYWGMTDTTMPYLGTLTLSTTGGSGSGDVVYTVTGSASCAIASNILTAGEVGSSCVITATKQMAGPYNAATTSSRTISVTKIAQANTISFTNSNTVQYGNTITVNAVGGSGSGSVEYSVVNAGNTGCSINASSGELTVTSAGTCRVGAKRATSNNYRDYLDDYSTPTQDITVTAANQTIAFTSVIPTNPLAGDNYTVTGISSVGLQLAFSIDSGECTISNDVVTFTASGPCVLKGSQSGNNQYAPATDVYQSIAVGQRNQVLTYTAATLARTAVTYGDPTFLVTANSTESSAVVTFTLNPATTNSACIVTAEGLVSVLAVGSCAIQADAAGTTAFAAASPIVHTIYVLPAPAGAPFITSIAGGNQAITINFTEPSYDGGSSITGYQLVAVPQTLGFDTVYESGCSTVTVNGEATCTVRGLRNGVHYKMKVAALTSAGLGTYSDLSRSLQVATNPSAVQSLRVTQLNAQLVINWSDPESLGGGSFDSYRIFIKMSAAANYDSANYFEVRDDTIKTFTATKVTPVGADLANGVAYDIKVVTVTTANSLELSANTAVVNQIPRTVPGAPRFNNAIIMGSDVVLIWQSPVSDGGAEISAYSAQVASSTCVLDNPGDTFCTAPKPLVGGNYGYQIRAFNVAGSSDPATGTVQLGTPPPVVVIPESPVPPAAVTDLDSFDGAELADEVSLVGAVGTATFPDGSQITITPKGVVIPRIKSGYIGKLTGRVTLSYKNPANGAVITYLCPTKFKFGTTKKNKKLKKLASTNWFPKKYLAAKKGCKIPPKIFAAMKAGPVSVKGSFRFVRLWPTTAKPIRDNGSRIAVITRTMRVKMGSS